MVIEFAVSRFPGWSDTMKTQFTRTGFPGIDETPDVPAQGTQTKTIPGTNNLMWNLWLVILGKFMIRILNGQKEVGCQMVWFLNAIWIPDSQTIWIWDKWTPSSVTMDGCFWSFIWNLYRSVSCNYTKGFKNKTTIKTSSLCLTHLLSLVL